MNKHTRYKEKKKNSCEIEDFVETHLSKLCAVLRSRVLRVLYGLIQGIQSAYEEDKI